MIEYWNTGEKLVNTNSTDFQCKKQLTWKQITKTPQKTKTTAVRGYVKEM